MWSSINSALCLKGHSNCRRSRAFGDVHHLGDVSYRMVDDRSHIEYHVGSRAKIRVAPPCLVEAGSALRWFTFNHKSENMMLATSIWLDCTSNKCDYSINDNGKLKKCRHVSPHERLNRGQRSKRLKNDTQRHLDMDVSDIDVSERNSSMYCMICERWLRTYHWGNHKIGMKHCRYARQIVIVAVTLFQKSHWRQTTVKDAS